MCDTQKSHALDDSWLVRFRLPQEVLDVHCNHLLRVRRPRGPHPVPGGLRSVAPGGVDCVFDTSGTGVLADSVALAGDAGKVITIADPSFARHGVRFTGMDPADRFPEALPQLAGLFAAGKLDVPVGHVYPLAEAARAHAGIEARRNQGKVVLLP
ncbi:zinc-binding dehydrogenase [Streptomyces nigrescens]|uniref:zinc-binding dehydrogenase n=1 Tax=Streptomyces nigrescens TaxID=1920 RepID=UPI0036F78D9E